MRCGTPDVQDPVVVLLVMEEAQAAEIRHRVLPSMLLMLEVMALDVLACGAARDHAPAAIAPEYLAPKRDRNLRPHACPLVRLRVADQLDVAKEALRGGEIDRECLAVDDQLASIAVLAGEQ